MSLAVGDAAPAFRLPHRPGEFVDLRDHLGRDRVVLLFFPLAFSSVCTAELCAIRDRWSIYRELDARVLGISVDSPFTTARFREEHELPFPLLSDFNREAASDYEVLHEDFFGLEGVAKRAAFVIGTDGTISWAWMSEDDREPDYGALEEAVAAAP